MRWIAVFCTILCTLQAALFFTPEMISTHMSSYTEEEKAAIDRDLANVRSITFGEAKEEGAPLFYLATAGSPGSRKTTILEKFVASHPEYASGVYLDPDPRALKFMAHTYYSRSLNAFNIAQTGDYGLLLKQAYDKWRGGSTYIALTLLEEAFAARKSVIFGTTSTGAHMPAFLPKVKDAGYKTILLLCYAEDDLRREAITYRNETVRFYQSSPEDAVSKGKLFPLRMPTYFDKADLLYLYWSDDLKSEERLAAVFEQGKLTVHDAEALDRFIDKYERDRSAILAEGKEAPSFDELCQL
jgi:hypothetical protein